MKKNLLFGVFFISIFSTCLAMDDFLASIKQAEHLTDGCSDDHLWQDYHQLRSGENAVRMKINTLTEAWQHILWNVLVRDESIKIADSLEGIYQVLRANCNRCYEVLLGRQSILHEAAEKGYTDIVMLLLAVGAKCNIVRTWDKTTPLHIACSKGDLDIIKLLIWSGANKNAQDCQGITPMKRAHDYVKKNGGLEFEEGVARKINKFLKLDEWLEREKQQGSCG